MRRCREWRRKYHDRFQVRGDDYAEAACEVAASPASRDERIREISRQRAKCRSLARDDFDLIDVREPAEWTIAGIEVRGSFR